MKKIGLLFALYEEASSVLADEFYQWTDRGNGYYTSTSHAISLAITGVGKVYAAYALAKLVNDADIIIIMGTSGGLDRERVGDIYLAHEFVEHDMDVTGLGSAPGVTPYSPMQTAVLSNASPETRETFTKTIEALGINCKTGRIISGDLFLCSAEITAQKKELFNADLVDMESAAIAKICCTIEHKEVIAIRYISDNANHEAAGKWQENVQKSSVLFNSILKNIAAHFNSDEV